MSTDLRARLGINNCFAGRDADPYAWLEHFGPRIPEVQLQQTDGLGDRHWPFTPTRNAAGCVDPGRVLDALAAVGAGDVLQVIADLRACADVWARALAERGLR